MSDLIGRFLSFEEHLGRGLVKFAYYVALFYLVVVSLYGMIKYLFTMQFGEFLLVPFQFLLQLLLLRVGAELVMAILSIDDNLQGATTSTEGFEAGLTPSDRSASPTTVHDSPKPAPAEVPPVAEETLPAEEDEQAPSDKTDDPC